MCFKYGRKDGHVAKNCQNAYKCMICTENKLKSNYKMGFYWCINERKKLEKSPIAENLTEADVL